MGHDDTSNADHDHDHDRGDDDEQHEDEHGYHPDAATPVYAPEAELVAEPDAFCGEAVPAHTFILSGPAEAAPRRSETQDSELKRRRK
jgi:hypothetical protein